VPWIVLTFDFIKLNFTDYIEATIYWKLIKFVPF